MATVAVFDIANNKVGDIELNESKFLSACCCRSERKMRIKAIPLDS